MSRDLSIYRDARRFKARRRRYYERRERRSRGSYILGRFMVDPSGVMYVEAVAEQAGFWLNPRAELTRNCRAFYRWETRQGCHRYFRFHPELPQVMVINLARTIFVDRRPTSG